LITCSYVLASDQPLLIIPEVVLKNTLDVMLAFIREDAKKYQKTPQNSFLNRLLEHIYARGGDRYAYLEEAKAIFLADPREPKALVTRLFFDPSRAANPTIHFDLPGEDEAENGIGLDEDSSNAIYTQEELEGMDVDFATAVYVRRYKANYNIICTGASPMQTLIIYNVVRAWLIAGTDHLAFSGLHDPHLSGNDLILKTDAMPVNLFARAIRFRAAYEIRIPALLSQQIISQLEANGTPSPDH
jgi:hypothetical protein